MVRIGQVRIHNFCRLMERMTNLMLYPSSSTQITRGAVSMHLLWPRISMPTEPKYRSLEFTVVTLVIFQPDRSALNLRAPSNTAEQAERSRAGTCQAGAHDARTRARTHNAGHAQGSSRAAAPACQVGPPPRAGRVVRHIL